MRPFLSPRLILNPTPEGIAKAMANPRTKSLVGDHKLGDLAVGCTTTAVVHHIEVCMFVQPGDSSPFLAWVPVCCKTGGNCRAFAWKHTDQTTACTCKRCQS